MASGCSTSDHFQKHKSNNCKGVVLAYPDYSQGFEIYTDSSKFQLGAVITQNNRPLVYSVTKQELLAIVETLKEFKGILWGQTITVYMDHKNLMQDALGLTCDWVYPWILLLEDYGPTIEYIRGIHNTVQDSISWLDYWHFSNNRDNWMIFTQCWCHCTARGKETSSFHANYTESMNFVFANHREKHSIYPRTTR